MEKKINSIELTVRSYAKDIEKYQSRFIKFFKTEFSQMCENKMFEVSVISAKCTTINYRYRGAKIPCPNTPIIECTFKIEYDNKIEDIQRRLEYIYCKFKIKVLVYTDEFDYIVNIT